MRKHRSDEVWRRAKARMDRVARADKAKVLREELAREGISEGEAVRRVVSEYLGENPGEDQLRTLAATFASAFGMKPDRFLALWREARANR